MQRVKARRTVRVQRNNLSYYGYSLKYCLPAQVIGKRIRGAKLYFEHNPVLEYRYDRKKKKDCITFVSEEVRELFLSHIELLSKLRKTPSTPIEFIRKMFHLLEMEQVFVESQKAHASGIMNLYGAEDKLIFTAIVKNFEKADLNKVMKMYNGNRIEKVTSIDYFQIA